jgi:SAM-dependent methyltransferase
MKHPDHVDLLRGGIAAPGGTWADIGSGTGAFTLALAELLGPGGVIYSVDRDRGALQAQATELRARFPSVSLHPIAADFTQPLGFPGLDGMVMANALHFVAAGRQVAVVRALRAYLKRGGRLVLVEYNVERGNLWVPHPFTFGRWQEIARQAGFAHTRLLATRPSSFLKEFYAALSVTSAED